MNFSYEFYVKVVDFANRAPRNATADVLLQLASKCLDAILNHLLAFRRAFIF